MTASRGGTQPARIVPWLPLTASACLGGAALWLEWLNPIGGSPSDAVVIPIMLAYAVAAGVIGTRHPGNRTWWLLAILPLAMIGGFACDRYAIVAALGPLPLPFAGVGPAAAWLWQLALASPVLLAFLVPTGAPLPGVWRVLFKVEVTVLLVVVLVFATGSSGGELVAGSPLTLANPLFIPPMQPLYDALQAAYWVYLAMFLAGVVALAVRFRRSRDIERQQLKWILFAFATMLAGLAVSSALPPVVSDVVFAAAMLPVPAAIAIAILRYRLYEIDRIISRTLSYAIVTAVLAGVFAGFVLGLQALLASVTGASTLAVAASTLAVFALFQPLRRRVQHLVDRRFNRSRVDADAALAALTAHLRDETDLARVARGVEAAVLHAVSPVHAAIWTRDRGLPR